MWLFPSQKQFKNWSLPSKISYLGFWVSILLAILIPLVCHFNSATITKTDIEQLAQKEDIKKIEEHLNAKMGEIQRVKENQFLSSYNLGYQLVAFDRYNNVIPFDSKIRFDYVIEWDKTRIKKSNGLIEVTLPTIWSLNDNSEFNQLTMSFEDGLLGLVNYLYIGEATLVLEALEYDYYGYICVIGLTDKEIIIKK
jgi:hypothetical protein